MRTKLVNSLARYFLFFLSYSVIGWLYEVFLEVVVYRWGFSNRGVLHGPYCIIYGVGALIFIFTLTPLKRTQIRLGKIPVTPLLVFLGIMAISTGVELAGSYIMEAITGSWMWDYRQYAFHFQGRIALSPSIRFGIGGMLFLYVLQPLLEQIAARLPNKILCRLSGILGLAFLTDVAVTFLGSVLPA